VVICAYLLGCTSKETTKENSAVQKYPPVVLWREATMKCDAEYPASSRAGRHQGLAVVEMDIASDGSISRFSILQAPDVAITQAVSKCASSFRAAASHKGGAMRRSKLFFYFVLSGDKGDVFVVNDLAQKAKLVQLRRDLGVGWLK